MLVCLLAPLGAANAFGAAEPARAVFPLKVGAGGRALVDARGRPFFVQGDTPWSLTHNLTFEESVRYMEDRRARVDLMVVGIALPCCAAGRRGSFVLSGGLSF